MKHTNTGVDDREQWRARIMRAIDELRGTDFGMDSHARADENGEDSTGEAARR